MTAADGDGWGAEGCRHRRDIDEAGLAQQGLGLRVIQRGTAVRGRLEAGERICDGVVCDLPVAQPSAC